MNVINGIEAGIFSAVGKFANHKSTFIIQATATIPAQRSAYQILVYL
jgi:hypothetical protein